MAEERMMSPMDCREYSNNSAEIEGLLDPFPTPPASKIEERGFSAETQASSHRKATRTAFGSMRKLNILAAALMVSGLLGTCVPAMAQSSSQSSSSQSALPSAPTPVSPTRDKTKQGTTPAANSDQST